MAYWLVKSEPSSWSWDQQVAKGAKGEAWTGVRNFTARQNLVKMKKGDLAFFYHSNEGKDIVGIAEIIKEAYPDPSDKTGKFVCVDLKADKPLKTPVTMAAIKADKRLADMALVKYSRLSVHGDSGGMENRLQDGRDVVVIASSAKQSTSLRSKDWIASSLTLLATTMRPAMPPLRSRPLAPAAFRVSTASGSPSWSRRSARGCRLRRR